ncbi:hypothetical protein ACLB2K_003001 [Fragaria x ananassa]
MVVPHKIPYLLCILFFEAVYFSPRHWASPPSILFGLKKTKAQKPHNKLTRASHSSSLLFAVAFDSDEGLTWAFHGGNGFKVASVAVQGLPSDSEPATVEKCSELSKQLFYTRLASLPGRKESLHKELDYVKGLWKNRQDLKVEDAGIAALFGLECFCWFCAGEIAGRGFTFTGYYV